MLLQRPWPVRLALPPYFSALAIFAVLMLLQALSFLFAGTGRLGLCISGIMVVVSHLVALVYAAAAFRRARGNAVLFWLLFMAALVILLIPSAIALVGNILNRELVSPATWRVLYVLYGAPIVMIVLLPASDHESSQPEILLDFLQVVVVVALVFATFFYLPLQQMFPPEALERNLTISNLESVFLLMIVFLRLHFTRLPSARDRLLRLGLFVVVCASVTFIGNWFDQHHYTTVSAWWDLGWDLPILTAALVAVTWKPSVAAEPVAGRLSFFSFLTRSLALVTLVFITDIALDEWKESTGLILADLVVAAYLLVFSVRLALTQYRQQREISHRKAAQLQLTTANQQIAGLLEESKQQTLELAHISQLSSLLQACSSRADALRIISQGLRGLYPTVSGALSLVSASGERAESVVHWGPFPPDDQSFSTNECWALRIGHTHHSPAGDSALLCAHLRARGTAICVPLIANGKAIGTLALQDEDGFLDAGSQETGSGSTTPSLGRVQMVNTISEHVALALANIDLRDALRGQAIRDHLTGLYNRRFMEEFLDRELLRARRKNRPLAVMMLDLDHFKKLNDTWGHGVGDAVLRAVGSVLLRSVRSDDFACRYGGEEFLIIMPECPLQEAVLRAGQIRTAVKDAQVSVGETQVSVTVSIGVAAFTGTDRDNSLLQCADAALYRAKREGRDRVVAANSTKEQAITASNSPQ